MSRKNYKNASFRFINGVSPYRSSPRVTSCPLSTIQPLDTLTSNYYLHTDMNEKSSHSLGSSELQPLPRWASHVNKTNETWRKGFLALAALSALAIYTLNPLSTTQSSLKCPYQPAPLHPNMVWTPTDEEKRRSADLLSQAVVRINDMGELMDRGSLLRALTIMGNLMRIHDGLHLESSRAG